MNPLGGHIGSDGDGLGPKQPELFDIHVMIFCGDPESTVDGLARFFAIDREAAARLVEETPVVVKRAAEPDVAAEMLDVLGTLGAQVVLLPAASAVPSETDLLELKAPSVAPPALSAQQNTPPAATWGALEPIAAPAKKLERAPRAATVDLLAAAPMAELELSPSSLASGESRAGAKSAATMLEARAPTRSAPPGKRGVIDEDMVIAPLYEPGEAQARTRKPVDVTSVSLPPALEAMESLPPALGEPLSSVPPAPVVQTLPPVRASVPDLGLGSVPPLPALGAPGGPPPVPGVAMRGGPPRVPPPSPRPARPQPPPPPGVVPAPAQQRAQYERTIDTDTSFKLPSLGVAPTTGSQAAATKPAGGGDNYWSGRRAAGAALELGEVEAPAAPAKAANQAVAAGGAPGEALRDVPMRPIRANIQETETVRSRSAVRAALEIGAGMIVFVFFMQSNNSILLGNADVVAIVMHGFAIFGIGAGVLELRG